MHFRFMLLVVGFLFTFTLNQFSKVYATELEANGTGFQGGNRRLAVELSGAIHVDCSQTGPGAGGPSSAHYSCRQEILEPGEFDTFTGPKGTGADEVTLTAIHADGEKVTKSEDYDSKKGSSEDTFNLWISTLFQTPLLDMGTNRLNYTLKNKGKKKAEGTFEVQVVRGEARDCNRTGFYYSNNPNDCVSSDYYCGQYFRDNNYCK